MGVILSYDKSDIKTIHSTVYSVAKKEIPAIFYRRLIDSSNVYRDKVASNPEEFQLQFPFYNVKPLYTGLAYLFYKAGIPLTKSTVLPSVISYFIISLLLFQWVKKYWTIHFAFLVSLLIMFSAPLLSVLQLSTPDCLSALLLFSAIYLIIEKQALIVASVFLILSVFARIDNALPSFLILSMLCFFYKGYKRIPVNHYVIIILLLAISFFSVSTAGSVSGWSKFYYPSFYKHLNISNDIHQQFSLTAYFALVKTQFLAGVFYSSLWCFLVLSTCLFAKPQLVKYGATLPGDKQFILLFIFIISLRFILQPVIADRLYIAYYLSTIVLFIRNYFVKH